jgi:uncharacterized repeat protein (TIGR04138 family)
MPTCRRPPHWPTGFKPPCPGDPMEIPPLREAIARICSQDKRYFPEAYLFLHEGLMQTLRNVQKAEKAPRQISGAELSNGLREAALQEFGPLAKTVLNRWGVRTTRDFGEIVFVLLDAGLLGKTDEDRIEDFDNIYTFEEAFRAPFQPTSGPLKKPAQKPPETSPKK